MHHSTRQNAIAAEKSPADTAHEAMPSPQALLKVWKKSVVAPEAELSLRTSLTLSGMIKVAGMADLHPGLSSPVGAAFASRKIHPSLVGGDIGCGMLLCSTAIKTTESAERMAKRLGSLDGAWSGDAQQFLADRNVVQTEFARSLGTIGGGNHFAELQQVHQIVDPQMSSELGLDKRHLALLVHSGSRGLGAHVLRSYNEAGGESAVAPDDRLARKYLAGHNHALQFSQANRALIALRVGERLGGNPTPRLQCTHNFVESQVVAGENLWLHRKGASAANQGVVVIPGSRGSYSYIVKPVGDGHVNLFSLPHGAGRRVPRNRCKEKFGAALDLTRPRDQKGGILGYVVCGNQDLLTQEYQGAYKDIERIIADLLELGLIRVVAIMKPVLTYKERAQDTDGEG